MLEYLVTSIGYLVELGIPTDLCPVLQKCVPTVEYHYLVRDGKLWILYCDDFYKELSNFHLSLPTNAVAVGRAGERIYVLFDTGIVHQITSRTTIEYKDPCPISIFLLYPAQVSTQVYLEDPTLPRYEPATEISQMTQYEPGFPTFVITVYGKLWVTEGKRLQWKLVPSPELIYDYQYYRDTRVWIGASGRMYVVSKWHDRRLVELEVKEAAVYRFTPTSYI